MVKSLKSAAKSSWQGKDPVFFHRGQVSIGTRLINFGRLYHNTVWEVVEIMTCAKDTETRRKAKAIQRLDDNVTLHRLGANEFRSLCFASLSYSAIWRLVRG